MTSTNELLHGARQGLEGKDPRHGWLIQNGSEKASAHALVALAAEQQATNVHLASIADSLTRIAAALEQPTPAPPERLEPKRRLWLPSRRNA